MFSRLGVPQSRLIGRCSWPSIIRPSIRRVYHDMLPPFREGACRVTRGARRGLTKVTAASTMRTAAGGRIVAEVGGWQVEG